MKPHLLVLAVYSVLALSIPGARAAETVYDGTFWRSSSPEIKHFFVQGFLSGVLLGQDRVLRQGLPGEAASSLAPECHRALTRIVNALERQIERWDPNRLVAALDTFYEDPDRRPLGVRWALMTVILEMHGRAQEGLSPS